jgi:hypothetical protein
MNIFLAGCMALTIALFSCQRCDVVVHANQAETQQIAKDFSYPESPETITVEVPYEAKSLAGRVADVTDAGLEKVLVERLSSGRGKRLDAIFTDSNGFFSLRCNSSRVQYLKLSKPGFDTLLIKVVMKKDLKSRLDVKLGVSQ